MPTAYEVIVVGGGGSGLAAAVSAAQHGASVLLIEKQPQLGGSTGIAVGSFTTNQTLLQQKAGIADRLEDHVEDAGKFARVEIEARNNGALRRFHLAHSNDTLRWLMDMGLRFHGPSPEPPNRVPRMHNVVPNAKAYIATLQGQFLRRGGTIICNAPVKELVRCNGRVAGVIAEVNGRRQEYGASRGVILAAGDYAAAPDLVGRFLGEQFTSIEGINPYCHGDGHHLAESVGAPLINMDVVYGPELRLVPPPRDGFMQLLPASGPLARLMGYALPLVPKSLISYMVKRLLVTWQHPENVLFTDGAILVNSRGERFCNENVWPDREIAIARQPDKICYILLDERLIDRYTQWPHFISTAPEIAYAYVADYLKLRPDVAVQADSPAGVGALRNLPVVALQASLTAYNQYARGEATDAFGRIGDNHPFQGQRWVLLGPAKAYFTTTEGSPPVNEQQEVLDAAGRSISGLYAVGQNGLGGQVLWGHGLHIAWAMTSGRLVGKRLATMAGEER
jgi:succinate dehydrogenase/fumarate reductase flavoprotein subunit